MIKIKIYEELKSHFFCFLVMFLGMFGYTYSKNNHGTKISIITSIWYEVQNLAELVSFW